MKKNYFQNLQQGILQRLDNIGQVMHHNALKRSQHHTSPHLLYFKN